MTSNTEIRRLLNGAIDTNYYLKRGRKMRSKVAHDIVRATGCWMTNKLRNARELENPFDIPTSVYRDSLERN